MFKGYFLDVVDELAPVKEIRIKQRTEPWMNADILEMITLRDKAFYVLKGLKMSLILPNLRNSEIKLCI